MDTITTVRDETTQYLLSEMKQQLPRISKELGTNSEDVHVISYDNFPNEYMESEYRDKVLKSIGALPDFPQIQFSRAQGGGRIGVGIYLYETKTDSKIKYALYCARGIYGPETYLVIQKGQYIKLHRHAVACNKLANKSVNIPILAGNLLEEVLQNTIGFLKKSKKIEKFGVKIKRGVVLTGDPGNGKTMLCRYIQKLCSQNGIDWGVITSADIDQAYGEKGGLNHLFHKYSVSFFDDIDIQYLNRSRGNGKMACSLLTAMDGMSDKEHLIRIFTTNENVDSLDAAFMRPGRIDKVVTFNNPTENLRRELVLSWPKEILNNIDVNACVKKSEGFSFAELEAVRTLLVTNKILGSDEWDLENALKEYHSRQKENVKSGMGFGFSQPSLEKPYVDFPMEDAEKSW